MAAGGRYEIRDGEHVLVEQTREHPQGNRPRDAKGNDLRNRAQAKPSVAPKKTSRADTKAGKGE